MAPSPQRSRNMAAIAGRNTRPELWLRSAVFALGLRYRLHVKALPGSPDLLFPKYRAAVFVHGCFWHRHAGCRFTAVPKSNAKFWNQKFARNVARDASARIALREKGWRVATVWECGLKDSPDRIARRLEAWLRSGGLDEIDLA
jgi:DNA mismatch endonuclease, patch repair protein